MSQQQGNPDEPYSTESQNAIFHFLFVLVNEYSKTMDPLTACTKACDWLISLAEEVKAQARNTHEAHMTKEK